MSSNPYRTFRTLNPYFSWKAYMDWNGDGFWCRDAIPTDRANQLTNPLTYSLRRYEAKGTATAEITTGFGARTRYGNEFFSVNTNADQDGINIFKNGANYDISTTNGTVYTLVCWVRHISGLSAGNIVCRTRTASDSVTKNTVNLAIANMIDGLWTRVQMQFTATASDNLTLQIVASQPSAVAFQVTGLMYFTGTTPIPLGFNTGATNGSYLLDGYDNISVDLRKMNWFLGMRQPYQDVCDDQTASITVFNGDQKYTPENPDSPIYGKLINGRNCSIEYEIEGAYRTYAQMYVGRCDFASVGWRLGELAGKVEVTIPFTWYTKMMKENQVDLGLYTDTLTGTIIRNLVSSVYDMPVNLIDDGLTTIEDYGDAPSQTEWQTIVEVTGAERGRFFVARDGRPTFWDRHHLLGAGSETITATVDSSKNADYYPPRNLQYIWGGSIYNIIRVKVNPRQTGASETLWELDNPITIPVSDSIEVWITLRRDNGQFAASGSLTLSGATYSSGTTTNTIDEYGGRSKLTLANASATVEAVLTALTVTGAPQITQNAMEYIAQDLDANLSAYGRHELSIDMVALSSINDAQDLAEFELLRRKTVTGDVLWLQYKHASDGVENYHQYTWEIGDRLTVILPEFFHERVYVIMGEEHSVDFTKGKEHHETKFLLEPAYPVDFWLLGLSGNSELGETTHLGY